MFLGICFPLLYYVMTSCPLPHRYIYPFYSFLIWLFFHLPTLLHFFQVEIEIGEKRVIAFNGAGLSVAPEISFDEIAATHKSPEEVCLIFKFFKCES